MTALDLADPVAVVGTGTMGQGIAQVALVAGHRVRLYDAVPGRARAAAGAIGARLDRLAEKDRLTGADRDAARTRLTPAESLAELADSHLGVEAVLERLDVKQQLLRELEEIVKHDCLPATNTSSLSAVGGALRKPGRFVGVHFFNPAPLLPLVESRRLGESRAYDEPDEMHLRHPSGRYAPSLALYRHAYASEKREGTP